VEGGVGRVERWKGMVDKGVREGWIDGSVAKEVRLGCEIGKWMDGWMGR